MGASPLLRFSLADELAAVRRRLPSQLFSDEALAASLEVVAGMPTIFNWMILEAQSSGVDPGPADVLAGIVEVDDEREAIAAARDPPQAYLASSWSLLRAWARREGPELAALRILWFEWDAPFARRVPLVLPCIDPRFWGSGARPTASFQVSLAAAVHRALFSEELCEPERAGLLRAIEALPRGGRALSTASLCPRGVARSRLFVELPRDHVIDWLEAIAWPGDRERVADLLPRILMPWESAFLQIEVDPAVGPYLSVEPRQHGEARAEVELRRLCLRGLVDRGEVDATFADAVIGWSGSAPLPGGRIRRRNFHLKHIIDGDRDALRVKAYFGVYHTSA